MTANSYCDPTLIIVRHLMILRGAHLRIRRLPHPNLRTKFLLLDGSCQRPRAQESQADDNKGAGQALLPGAGLVVADLDVLAARLAH